MGDAIHDYLASIGRRGGAARSDAKTRAGRSNLTAAREAVTPEQRQEYARKAAEGAAMLHAVMDALALNRRHVNPPELTRALRKLYGRKLDWSAILEDAKAWRLVPRPDQQVLDRKTADGEWVSTPLVLDV